MTWIKDNKFLVALLGGTLVGIAALYFFGSKAASTYQTAKEEFDAAAADASSYERLALYPRPENRDGKTKALDDYRESVKALQAAFEPFRSAEITNVSPQEFTDRLKSVNAEVIDAFTNSKTKFPEAFFSGFEEYRTSLANKDATGLMGYQLSTIKSLMLELSKSGVSELRNFHRVPLPEEQGRKYTPQPNDVARPMPLEITFTGTEKSVREFLSAITKTNSNFVVIRTVRVINSKKDAPRANDAKFEAPSKASDSSDAPGSTGSDDFGADFVVPGEPVPDDAAEADAPPQPPPAPPKDSSRILSQVLGNEQVHVFLRLDVLQFLPAKPLP